MNVKKSVMYGLLILIWSGACSPVELTPSAARVQAGPAEDVPVIANESAVPSTTPAPTAVEELTYLSYLPHVTKVENVSQTIDGVTAQIDEAYVDEGRVAIQYTISGLDWPDGSMLDMMQQVRMDIPAISTFRSGGFSGAGGANVNQANQGVITGISDQLLLDGALDAEKYPTIIVNVDIPVVGPTNVGTFHLSFTAPVANGIKIEDIAQTVVANNVSMRLESLILNPSHAQAVICFQMPSPLDWGLTASTITVGDKEYPFTGGGLASGKNDLDSALTSPERCNEIGFDVIYDVAAVTSVTLTVPKLMASVNEVVTEETVNKANQRLADTGIVFDYENIDHGGNIVILARPDGMSDEQIYPLIWDALTEQYEGPWVFTVPIP